MSSATSSRQPIVLRVHKAGALVGVKQFLDSQIVLGRQPDLQLPLDGDAVAFIHAAIEERDGRWYLADLGSETGTKRNSEVVLDVELQSGDVIEVADYRIEFFIGVPRPKSAPPPVTASLPVMPPPQPPSAPPPKAAPPPQAASEAPAKIATPPSPNSGSGTSGSGVAPRPPQRPTETAAKSAPGTPVVNVLEGTLGTDGLAVPSSRSRLPRAEKRKKAHRTFAAPSRHSDIRQIVKPTKGTVIEVIVAWKERIIATRSFSGQHVVTVGSHPSCDLPVPIMGAKLRKLPVVKVGSPAIVTMLPEMEVEVMRGQSVQVWAELQRINRLTRDGNFTRLSLEQGELAKIDVGEGISIIVRYVAESPKPLAAPFFDLTNSEITGVILSLAMMAVLGLYANFYIPAQPLPPEAGLDEPLRTAVVIVKPTPPPPPPPPPEPTPVRTVVEIPPQPQPTPPPQPVVRATPAPVKQTVVPRQQQATTVAQNNRPAGQAANPAPNRNQNAPRVQTSVKQGGAIKTTDKPAAQMQSRSKDASKSGIFSTFGAGANDRIAGSTTGAGALAGIAGANTGASGMNEDRQGTGLGSSIRDTGQGGTGTALDRGVRGGRGSLGSGTGASGLGQGGIGKLGVKVQIGQEGAEVGGTIDKEAIRRVIRANLTAIQKCYERELNRTPDLVGKLVIEWDIGEQGVVLRTGVRSNELGSREVANCLMARLKTWRFPEPPANEVVTVAYPFVFSN